MPHDPLLHGVRGSGILHLRSSRVPGMHRRRRLPTSDVHALHRWKQDLHVPEMYERQLWRSNDQRLCESQRAGLHEREPMPGARVPDLRRWKHGMHGCRLHQRSMSRGLRTVPAVQGRRRLRQARLQRLLRRKHRLRNGHL